MCRLALGDSASGDLHRQGLEKAGDRQQVNSGSRRCVVFVDHCAVLSKGLEVHVQMGLGGAGHSAPIVLGHGVAPSIAVRVGVFEVGTGGGIRAGADGGAVAVGRSGTL